MPISQGKKIIQLTVTKKEATEEIEKHIKEAKEIIEREVYSKEGLENLQNDIKIWNDYTKGLLSHLFDTNDVLDEYLNNGAVITTGGFYEGDIFGMVSDEKKFIKANIVNLQSILKMMVFYQESGMNTPKKPEILANTSKQPTKKVNRVFIVHGRNDKLKDETARLMTKLSLDPLILHEQPNEGRTIIEKFEDCSDEVVFAVVLLTADDEGRFVGEDNDFQLRARQNVILEHGYFLGALKRKKVCALYEQGVELPSDTYGILYIPIDDYGAWKMKLATEIKESGIEIDLNDLL